jgi:hypothetical protein
MNTTKARSDQGLRRAAHVTWDTAAMTEMIDEGTRNKGNHIIAAQAWVVAWADGGRVESRSLSRSANRCRASIDM